MTPTPEQGASPSLSNLTPVYEPPHVELVLTAEDLAREYEHAAFFISAP